MRINKTNPLKKITLILKKAVIKKKIMKNKMKMKKKKLKMNKINRIKVRKELKIKKVLIIIIININ